MDKTLLHVRHLKKYFPVSVRRGLWTQKLQAKAVDDVSLVVTAGESFGLVGESGCGKTTLGRAILRLEDPTAGEIIFDGQNIMSSTPAQVRRLRREMQLVFQDPYSSLSPRLTVGRIIGEPLKVHGMYKDDKLEHRLEELIRVVGLLPEHMYRYPHEFSGGQRQRICMARALALNPKIIIADEPVSALDVSIQAQILNLMVELQKKFDLTYILISHDLSVVRHLCDRVAVMYLGRIVESAPTALLFNNPGHPYTRALLSSVPVPNPDFIRQRIVLTGDVPSLLHPPDGCAFHPRCPSVMDICRKKRPELMESDRDHFIACHQIRS